MFYRFRSNKYVNNNNINNYINKGNNSEISQKIYGSSLDNLKVKIRTRKMDELYNVSKLSKKIKIYKQPSKMNDKI